MARPCRSTSRECRVNSPATTAAERAERVALKKCTSSLPVPIIIPRKVISRSGGRSLSFSAPSSRASKGAAQMERPPAVPPGASGW
jgi:hypothetical protein